MELACFNLPANQLATLECLLDWTQCGRITSGTVASWQVFVGRLVRALGQKDRIGWLRPRLQEGSKGHQMFEVLFTVWASTYFLVLCRQLGLGLNKH